MKNVSKLKSELAGLDLRRTMTWFGPETLRERGQVLPSKQLAPVTVEVVK